MMQVALTIDLHAGDRPEHIDRCNDWLRAREIPATFLVPTAMLEQESFRGPIARLRNWRHDVGTHAHTHSDEEKAGLQWGTVADLDFLRVSQEAYEVFFSRPPRSFRSPTWCWINRCVMA
jgi:peptidoglycan/xylan/chitin deacetylase (PgdA/CDA1 family)